MNLKKKSSVQGGVVLPLTLGGLLLVVNVGHTVFTQLTANEDGSFPFHESSAVLVAELAKMLLALLALLSDRTKRSNDVDELRFAPTWRILVEMAVPALLYTISNILSYKAVGLLGSTFYQLMSNMKVIITAVVFRVVIRKPLKILQWLCFMLLTAGLLVTTISPMTTQSMPKPQDQISTGFVLMVLLSLASSFAGVFSELKLKQAPQHPMLQNSLMYAWSCVFCLTQYVLQSANTAWGGSETSLESDDVSGFFQGFSLTLWGAIITTAIYGQVVALIFYHCDNIVKVFSNSATVIASAAVGQFLFGEPLTIQVGIGAFIIFASTIIYYVDSSLLLQDDAMCISHSTAKLHRHFCQVSCLRAVVAFVCLLSPQAQFSIQAKTKGVASARGRIQFIPDNGQRNNVACDWPPPLYEYEMQPFRPDIVTSLQNLKQFFDDLPNSTFSYIDSGGALGLYRDGGLLPSDSDLDVRYGICHTCPAQGTHQLPSHHRYISMNDFSEFGDMWTRRSYPSKTDLTLITSVKRDMCLHEYTPGHSYWFHRAAMQRRAFQYTYGDFWFVRMPFWKGVHDTQHWKANALHVKDPVINKAPTNFASHWQRSLLMIDAMDTNRDGSISLSELNQKLMKDGIIFDVYNQSINERERCRATAMLTLLLQFQAKPFDIPQEKTGSNGDMNLFRFPDCADSSKEKLE